MRLNTTLAYYLLQRMIDGVITWEHFYKVPFVRRELGLTDYNHSSNIIELMVDTIGLNTSEIMYLFSPNITPRQIHDFYGMLYKGYRILDVLPIIEPLDGGLTQEQLNEAQFIKP